MADPTLGDSGAWGWAVAAASGLAAWLFKLKRDRRIDRTEESQTEVTLSLQGAQKVMYDTLREQMEAMKQAFKAEIKELRDQVALYVRLHTQCQHENAQLRLENDELKKGKK